jgi:CheY-like chemotaxis protein
VRGRVLIVEDEAAVRGMFRQILEEAGHEVREAGNGKEALEVLDGPADGLNAGWRPDLILLDLLMPVMNGWQLRAAQREREDLRDIPVVLVSGSPPRIQPIEAKALQVAASLRKPVRADVLLRTVEMVLVTNEAAARA